MSNIDVEILKRLILLAEADEDEEGEIDTTADAADDGDNENRPEKKPTEAPSKDEPKPGSFEDDPMGFILRKYVSLDAALKELMTPSYKEYVEAIFIVAPKPTTFKILLHNGQYFFLTYLGKAYEATVSGRNYYLTEIGEKERCMLSISKLLRFGSPLKTKGPEGAEQGTRDEEGGEAGGGESGGGAPSGGEVDTTAGGEEELEEGIKILRRLVMLEAAQTAKNPEDALIKYVLDNVAGGTTLKRNNKNGGPHLRGGSSTLQSDIKAVIGNASVQTAPAGDIKKGSRSGTYNTLIFTTNKNITTDKGEIIPKGTIVLVVDSTSKVKGGSAGIVQKSLTPVNLGLTGAYTSVGQLTKKINSAIKQKQPNLSPLISALISNVIKETNPDPAGLSGLATVKANIPYSKNTKTEIEKYSPSDASIVGKDFGELLGGIFLGQLVGIQQKLEFPRGNEPLIDFILDGYKISSKYDKGAAASITDLVKKINPADLDKKSSAYRFYNLLKPFTEKNVSSPDAFLNVAKNQIENMPAITTLAEIVGVEVEGLTRQVINDFVTDIIKQAGGNRASNAKKDKALLTTFDKFYKEIDRYPKNNSVEWDRLTPDMYYGTVTSPFSYYVKDKLNEVQEYKDSLKELVSKTEVKQMYMLFSSKSDSITFTIKSFNDPNANFEFEIPSISIYNPTSSKLGFKLK